MNRYARRKDSNHNAIASALISIGVGVLDTSAMGDGFCDLVTFHRGTIRHLEVKDGEKAPSARKLTIAQVRAHELARVHGCTIHVVTSADEALALHGARI